MFQFLKSLISYESIINERISPKWEVVSYDEIVEKPVEKNEIVLNEVNPSPLHLFKIQFSMYTDFFIHEKECKRFDDYETANQYGIDNYPQFYLRSK
jgi:hypothetical protein